MSHAGSPPLSVSAEMYLKTIYLLARERTPVGTGAIASELDVAPASVTGMLRTLSNQGWVAYEKHHGTRLTASGHEYARNLLRKHCGIERFLITVLGVETEIDVHDEACRLEHAMSDPVAAALARHTDQHPDCPQCYNSATDRCSRLTTEPS